MMVCQVGKARGAHMMNAMECFHQPPPGSSPHWNLQAFVNIRTGLNQGGDGVVVPMQCKGCVQTKTKAHVHVDQHLLDMLVSHERHCKRKTGLQFIHLKDRKKEMKHNGTIAVMFS